MNSSAAAAASRLETAQRDGKPCAPARDLLGDRNVDLAYRVQRLGVDRRIAAGERVVGHKIGLTGPVVPQQLGVDQPDFGVLFDAMDVSGPAVIPIDGLPQPRVEAEIAFRLGADLDGPDLAPTPYAEIVASIAAKSAGPGTRANIDEFTETTAAAIEQVGGATRGKALIILNPAEPTPRSPVRCRSSSRWRTLPTTSPRTPGTLTS